MDIIRLLQALLMVLSGTAGMSVYSGDIASGISTSYSTEFMQKEGMENTPANNMVKPQIYKFTDNNGKVTYSTSITADFIEAEEVLLEAAPPRGYVEATEQINGELKAAAQGLADAREERQALRDEKEKQRLERLVLINRSKPPVVYRQNNYVVWPYRYGSVKKHYSGYRPHGKPVHLPSGIQSAGHGTRAPVGISQSHHR